MAISTLAVRNRKERGKNAVRKIRRQGLIPAVLYGKDVEPQTLAIEERYLKRLFQEQGQSALVSLDFVDGGDQAEEKLAIIKDIQIDPISTQVKHVDFYAIRVGEPITVEVPLSFEGKAIGIAKGGLLQPVRRSIEIRCLPREIPEVVKVDVSDLDVGDAIHVNDLQMDGVEFVSTVNFTIVTVQGVKAEPAAGEEEGAEVEEEAAAEEAAAE
ncbi:MAG: 50S ribosomal protein L25 [Deltaproteobacteria bacterium]|jgi:large subunit ribosomal protein L25|nr:50S ribosomal protein L25 [Deltaproteobacteria bacterium]